MKKLFAIAFTCVYLTLAVGVVQTTHYCMGRVKSTSLYSFDSTKCPCYLFAKDAGKGTCCNDEHQIIKIEDDHAASHIVSIAPSLFEIGAVINQVFVSETCLENLAFFDENSPPPTKVPLFQKHCSLVFYDDETTA